MNGGSGGSVSPITLRALPIVIEVGNFLCDFSHRSPIVGIHTDIRGVSLLSVARGKRSERLGQRRAFLFAGLTLFGFILIFIFTSVSSAFFGTFGGQFDASKRRRQNGFGQNDRLDRREIGRAHV